MEANVRKIEVYGPGKDKNCWQEIANDPVKLGYWHEIARLWKESLGVDVQRLSNIEESSYNNHYRSS